MTAPDGRFPDDRPRSDPLRAADRLARAWARAVAGTSFVPMGRPELLAFLVDLADAISSRPTTAETFDRTAALRVGAALVDAHFTETGSIERTLAVLGRAARAGAAGRAAPSPLLLGARRRRLRPGPAATAPGASRSRSAPSALRGPGRAPSRRGGTARPGSGRSSPSAAIGIGIGRHRRHRSSRSTRRCADMLGYTCRRAARRTVVDFVHPDDAAGAAGKDRGAARRRARPLPRGEGVLPHGRPEVWTDLVALADPRPGRRTRSTWSR